MKITSVSNQLIKDLAALQKKKFRTEKGLFLLEGPKLLEEALKHNVEILYSAFLEGESLPSFVQDRDIKVYELSPHCMKKACSTDTLPKMVSVARIKETPLETVLQAAKNLIVILEDIKDPGNLGTVIRSCAAAEVGGIILTGNCVDLYSPKVLRATVGNIWNIPIAVVQEKDVVLKQLKDQNIKLLVADMYTESTIYDVKYDVPSAIVFGAEAEGVSDLMKQAASTVIKIPIAEKVESLNLGVSVAVTVFEVLRQRRG